MFALRPLVRLCALASSAALAAATAFAAESAAPPALPAWPDQAPSVYAQASGYTQADDPAPPIRPVANSVTPAVFEEPTATTADHVAPAQSPAPSTRDPRRLEPPSDHRLPHKAKRDPATDAANSMPSFGLPLDSMYTTGAALAVVLGLFLLFAGMVRRGRKKSNSLLPEEVVSVLGRVPLAARQFAELVRVGNKLVLVSVTPGGAEPLTEITEPAEIDRLVGLCRQRSKGSSSDEFDQVFRQLAEETAPIGFLGNEVPQVDARIADRLAAPADVYAAYRGGAPRA